MPHQTIWGSTTYIHPSPARDAPWPWWTEGPEICIMVVVSIMFHHRILYVNRHRVLIPPSLPFKPQYSTVVIVRGSGYRLLGLQFQLTLYRDLGHVFPSKWEWQIKWSFRVGVRNKQDFTLQYFDPCLILDKWYKSVIIIRVAFSGSIMITFWDCGDSKGELHSPAFMGVSRTWTEAWASSCSHWLPAESLRKERTWQNIWHIVWVMLTCLLTCRPHCMGGSSETQT